MSNIVLPLGRDKTLRRMQAPVSYDSAGRRMRLYAVEYRHGDRLWALEMWAYSSRDARLRLRSIKRSVAILGETVALVDGD